MKTLHLALMSDGKIVDATQLKPAQVLRLAAFGEANRLSLAEMAELSIRFATAPDGASPKLSSPDEDKIVEFAAKKMLNNSSLLPEAVPF
jgi:hypothetical protein